MTEAQNKKERIRAEAVSLGLEAFGVSGIDPPLRREYFQRWIASGQYGDMGWLARHNDRRLHPRKLLPEARSLICAGLNYYQPDPSSASRIAKYALGSDYHKVLMKKLKRICSLMQESFQSVQRPYVDTGPLLEKPVAVNAGLGWQGKSTILLNKEHGTWLFLGVIVTTLALPEDEPARDHCGSCSRCIEACPTGAITAPYQLDARRCLAYLTIEHRGAIPVEYRHALGNRVFGCDECLDVCPWNRFAQITKETKFAPRQPYQTLKETLYWTEEDFHEAFAGTPIRRLGLHRWWRNVAVVLGNIGGPDDLSALEHLRMNTQPWLAEHAAWAIAEINNAKRSRKE